MQRPELNSQVEVVVPRRIIPSRSNCRLLAVLTESQLYIEFTALFVPSDVGESDSFDVCSPGFVNELTLIDPNLPVTFTVIEAVAVLNQW